MRDRSWWEGVFETIDRKNLTGFLGFLTPDSEFRFANNQSVFGHVAVGAVVGGFFSAIGGSKHRFIHAWEDADAAVCEGEVTYTRHDGSTLTVPFVNVFYMQDDKISRYLIYVDNSALFA